MEYIGIIEPASKPFTRDDWLDYIAKDDCLVSAEPREICNPANGQMIVVWPNPDSVGLFVEGKERRFQLVTERRSADCHSIDRRL